MRRKKQVNWGKHHAEGALSVCIGRRKGKETFTEEETFSPDASPRKQPLQSLGSVFPRVFPKPPVLQHWQLHCSPQKRWTYRCFCTRSTSGGQLPWKQAQLEPLKFGSTPLLRAALPRRTWGCCGMTSWPWPSDVHWQPRRPTMPWAASPAAWAQGEGGDSAPLPRSAESPLSPASRSGALSTGQSWSCGSGAGGGPSNDPRAGTLCWEERLGELGLLSLGQRRLRGDLRAAASAWRGCERAGEGLGQGPVGTGQRGMAVN